MEHRNCIWNTTDRHCEYCMVEHCSGRTNVSNNTTSCSNEAKNCISINSDSIPNLDPELLTKDTCARIPYDLKVNYADKVYDVLGYTNNKLIIVLPFMSNLEGHPIETCKPYLRPMSSMTEEEKDYYDSITYTEDETHFKGVWCNTVVDWLNAHHFDYRGLIEKGLAIEASEGMYND